MTNTNKSYACIAPALEINLLLRVGKDAEMRFTPNGKAVMDFSAVASQAYQAQNGNGEWLTNDAWYKVTLWGDAATRMHDAGKEPHKGDIVMVNASSAKLSAQAWAGKDGPMATLAVSAASVKVIARVQSNGTTAPVNEPVTTVDPEQIPF